jgi:hypothetical protein
VMTYRDESIDLRVFLFYGYKNAQPC